MYAQGDLLMHGNWLFLAGTMMTFQAWRFLVVKRRWPKMAVFLLNLMKIILTTVQESSMSDDSKALFGAKFKPYTRQTISQARQWDWLPPEQREAVQVVSHVLPFRTNEYVLDQLIDWNNIPDDPIYRLVFPHRDMLPPEQYAHLRDLVLVRQDKPAIEAYVRGIRLGMNPHPAGQMTHNVPTMNDEPVRGLQHKYAQTVLFFPSAGQTCHAYCTFCFRWPQFVGMDDMKFDARESTELAAYLKLHTEVTDVLITGGDPMIMNTRSLAAYLEPLLAPAVCVRPRCGRLAAPVRTHRQGGQEPGHHGPLQPRRRIAPGYRPASRQAHRLDGRHLAHAGPTDTPHQ